MQERQRSWSVVWARSQWAVCHTGVGSNSIFCNRCKHWVYKNAVGSGSSKRLQVYMVPRNCMPLGWQTTDGSCPSRIWQDGGGKCILLPKRHALSSRWLHVNFQPQHMWKLPGRNSRSCYQFSFTPPLFQDMWPCVQLLFVEGNAPCQRDLAIDKAKPPTSSA